MSQRAKQNRARQRAQEFVRREFQLVEVRGILERARTAPLSAEEHDQLKAVIDTLAFITELVEAENVTGKQLRELLFGRPSAAEQPSAQGETGAAPNATAVDSAKCGEKDSGVPGAESNSSEKHKRKGHGRNGSESYVGATRVAVPHPTLQHKDRCPECGCGKLYRQTQPATLVRITGMAPFQGTVYEQERLRCNLCGEMFTAPPPSEVGEEKYDETVAAMLVLLHYGAGMPFHRLEVLQGTLGIPLPAGTQWEVIAEHEPSVVPVHKELITRAAQGEVVYHDDTSMKVLSLAKEIGQEIVAGSSERTGVFTSGIVSSEGERRIALFYTGRKHAGENLVELLQEREAERTPPIQMCDGASRNTPEALATILANCNAHARRKFGEVEANFPEPCRYVLDVFHDVYRNDARARREQMTPDERLALHQAESAPLLVELKQWMRRQFDDHEVEPNSGLGEAMQYMLRHWEGLTLFLRVAGAPLDNNVCERALKKAICHRKNSLFYKTENGARIGDMCMSLIHTAELNGANPFDYLVELMRHEKEVSQEPGKWLPWNYRGTLAELTPTSEAV